MAWLHLVSFDGVSPYYLIQLSFYYKRRLKAIYLPRFADTVSATFRSNN